MNRKNHLFIVGIDTYKEKCHSKLLNPVRDCNELIKELRDNYGFELITDELFNENATRRNIIEQLNSLSYSTLEEDNLIIYFAGHGHIAPDTSRGYWVPYDAANGVSDFVSHAEVIDTISTIKAKHIFLISDSCFSGALITRNRSATMPQAIKTLDNLKSRWVLSSGAEEVVSDGISGNGSPFSTMLIAFLKSNEKKHISIIELISEVSSNITTHTNQQPLFGPIENVGHAGGQMILVKQKHKDAFFTSKEHLHEVMRTHGYFKAQRYVLDRIEILFPELKPEIMLARINWNQSFRDSENIIETKLKEAAQDKWTTINNELDKVLEGLYAESITREMCLEFLDLVKARAKGEVESPVLEVLLVNHPEFSSSPIKEYLKGFKKKYSSIGQLKAKGLAIDIDLPMSWSLREGKRPNVLWYFQSKLGDCAGSITIRSLKEAGIDKTITDELSNDELVEAIIGETALRSFIQDENPTEILTKRTTIDGCQAAILEFESERVRIEIKVDIYTRVYYILWNEFMIVISFSSRKVDGQLKYPKEKYRDYFNLIMNSFVLNNQYL